VIIAAAWYVAVSDAEGEAATRVIDREGTGGVYKDERRECYQVTVGDRERSLIAAMTSLCSTRRRRQQN